MLLASISEGELAKGVKSSKWLIANETEMKGILSKSGITFDEIRASGTKIVVTRGANGADFYDRFQEYEAKSITPALVTDTSGADDAWRVAFWGSLLMGEGLDHFLKIANSWAAGFSVEKYGVVGNYPDMNEVYRKAGL